MKEEVEVVVVVVEGRAKTRTGEEVYSKSYCLVLWCCTVCTCRHVGTQDIKALPEMYWMY